jgi:hypothetical protein
VASNREIGRLRLELTKSVEDLALFRKETARDRQRELTTSADTLARVREEIARDRQRGEQPLDSLTDDALRRLQDAVRDESLRRTDDARLCPICVAADLDTIFSCGHRACGNDNSFSCVFV